MISLISSF